jgi:hypothetical protein
VVPDIVTADQVVVHRLYGVGVGLVVSDMRIQIKKETMAGSGSNVFRTVQPLVAVVVGRVLRVKMPPSPRAATAATALSQI